MKENVPVRKRILVVDDERSVRQLMTDLLSPFYEVKTIETSQEFRPALKSWHPDLVILDVNMPDEDGFGLCSHLRQEEEFRNVPVLFLSGEKNDALVKKGVSSGADGYLGKPFEFAELLKTVKALLEKTI